MIVWGYEAIASSVPGERMPFKLDQSVLFQSSMQPGPYLLSENHCQQFCLDLFSFFCCFEPYLFVPWHNWDQSSFCIITNVKSLSSLWLNRRWNWGGTWIVFLMLLLLGGKILHGQLLLLLCLRDICCNCISCGSRVSCFSFSPHVR